MQTSITEQIVTIVNTKIKNETDGLNFAKTQIEILDNAKTPYMQAITKIDSNLFEEIQNVNLTLGDVKIRYQDRINVGCRTDMFWRLSGISTNIMSGYVYNFVCTKITPNGYPPTIVDEYSKLILGAGSTAVQYLTPTGLATASNNLIGLQDDNYHALKIYDEPYSRDVVNSYVGSFIGTVGAASTVLTVMNPLVSGGLGGITPGQIIVSSKQFVFPTNSNQIVGIGTTFANLSRVDPGIATNRTLVNTLILKDPTILPAKNPEDDGSFVTFTVLIDPNQIINVGIPFGTSPYTPQTINIMTQDNIGTGVSVFYDNTGISSASKSWNQFLNGFQDPDDLRVGEVVVEPSVGSGKIYYPLGFDYKPMLNGSTAIEGDTAINDLSSTQATVQSLPACSAGITSALNTSILVRDSAETNFSAGISTFNTKLEITNIIRKDLNDINIRIWGYRGQIGSATANLETYNQTVGTLNEDYVNELLN